MKRLINILLLLPALGLFSCQEELNTYNESQNRLNFFYPRSQSSNEEREMKYTFVYSPSTETTAAGMVEVRTMGYLSDKDRKISFRQITEGVENPAIPGVHYVAFDNPSLAQYYVVKAGQNSAQIPVMMLRDASLTTKEYCLKFEIIANDDFEVGYPDYSRMTVYIADILTLPASWNTGIRHYFAGTYGPVKHRFMIDCASPLGIRIDNDFFADIMGTGVPDMGLTGYWSGFFSTKLREENARRQAAGLGLLREAPTGSQTEGALVQFTLNGTSLPVI